LGIGLGHPCCVQLHLAAEARREWQQPFLLLAAEVFLGLFARPRPRAGGQLLERAELHAGRTDHLAAVLPKLEGTRRGRGRLAQAPASHHRRGTGEPLGALRAAHGLPEALAEAQRLHVEHAQEGVLRFDRRRRRVAVGARI
ncbi:Uncharacterized protein (Fragment), partial [Durusdinium trenchii]